MNDGGPDRLSWQPPWWRRWLYGAGALVAVGLAATSATGPFALGSGIAFLVIAGVLLVVAGLDLWYGSALVADREGLQVRSGPGRTLRVPWADIERIESTTTSSRGLLRLASLEIDLGEHLVVLSRHRLGTDPDEVALALRRWWRSERRPR